MISDTNYVNSRRQIAVGFDSAATVGDELLPA